jgi:hypothetical protein
MPACFNKAHYENTFVEPQVFRAFTIHMKTLQTSNGEYGGDNCPLYFGLLKFIIPKNTLSHQVVCSGNLEKRSIWGE